MVNNNSFFSGLINGQVSVKISEPWEFEDEVGSSILSGTIADVYKSTHLRKSSQKTTEYLIVHLLRPFGYKKLKTEFLMRSPRHEGSGLSEPAKGEEIPVNFYRSSPKRVFSDHPFEWTRWRNDRSFGLIGSIKLKTL